MNKDCEPAGGQEAARRFDALVRKVLSVPRDEIIRREAEYKRQSLANPKRRGPKPKASSIDPIRPSKRHYSARAPIMNLYLSDDNPNAGG